MLRGNVPVEAPALLAISNVAVFPILEPAGKTRAIARVVLAGQLQLTGLRVVEGTQRLFVSYPNDPSYKGDDYHSSYYPVTRELREAVEAAVLAGYAEAIREPTYNEW
jgi:stage V sporulation protein G